MTFFLLFIIEQSFTPIIYYSIINLRNSSWTLASGTSFTVFKVLSGFFIVTIILYTAVRWYTNNIGGIYSFKRILLGLILGIASISGGIDNNIGMTMGSLITC